MRPWQRLAATEILEQRRQPAMLFILVANYLLLLVLFGGALWWVEWRVLQPGGREALIAEFEVDLDAILQVAVRGYGAISVGNLPLSVAYLAGYSVLHERTVGTWPFLMLAPLGRRELLIGKVAGVMAIPLALHLVLVGVGWALFSHHELVDTLPLFSGSAAWWVAFLLGAPAAAALVGALGTVISALSSDVRTSMQYTSFFIGLLSLGIGYALVDCLEEGEAFELGFAAACLVLAGVALEVGARIISRDVA